MSRKPESPVPAPVTRGDGVLLPHPARRAGPSPAIARKALSPRIKPGAHGRRSEAIGGRADASKAFDAWLRTEKGLDPDQRLSAAQLAELGAEFSARPIHGHRRTVTSEQS